MVRIIICFFIFILPALQCTDLDNNNSPTIKYFGTLVYSIGDGRTNKYYNFEIADLNKINELDSILDFSGTKVSSGERFYTINRIDLYRVLENTDTLCYMMALTEDNHALIHRYSNCETGWLMKTTLSILLGDFFVEYFREQNINNN